jgi:endoglucanase Acf2
MATKSNLIIDQGSDYTTTIELTDDNNQPIDLTGYTGEGQIRKYYTSTTAIDFEISLSNTGLVTIGLDANTSNHMEAGRYVYDVELSNGDGKVSRILEGIVTITPSVTR